MSDRSHARARRLLVRRHERNLSPRDEAWLLRHLGDCDACARIAEAYGDAEAALYPRSTGLSPAARDRIWARLEPSLVPAPPSRSSRGRWAVGAGGAAAAALSGFLLLLPATPSPPDELTARGAAASASDLRLRILLISSDRKVSELGATLPHDARLAFLVNGLRCPCEVRIEASVAGRAEEVASGVAGPEPTRVGRPVAVPEAWWGQKVSLSVKVVGAASDGSTRDRAEAIIVSVQEPP